MSRQQLPRTLLLSLFVFALFCITTLALPTGHTGDLATRPGTAIIPRIVPTMNIFDLEKRQYDTYPVNSGSSSSSSGGSSGGSTSSTSSGLTTADKIGLGVGIPGALGFFVTVYLCIRSHRNKGGEVATTT